MKMTYQEACQQIALNTPLGVERSEEDFRADVERAKQLSDPATWPDSVK